MNGEYIRKKRLDMGLSIQDLAEIVGVPRSTVWRIEKGSMNPSEGMLLRFERVFTIGLGKKKK